MVESAVFYSLSLYDTPRCSSASPGVGPTDLRYDRRSILEFTGAKAGFPLFS